MATLNQAWTNYDDEEDIFYVRLRDLDILAPRTEELEHGVLVDRDPQTKDIIGIEILDFLGHFAILRDLQWLIDAGVPLEVLTFLQEKRKKLQQQQTTANPFE